MQLLKYIGLICLAMFFNRRSLAQITSPNLVQEEIIKISGITADNQINGLSVTQKQTSRLYFDGLGRPVQEIAVQASSAQKDIIIYNSYNNLGQQAYSYLPYVGSDGSGAYHTAAATEQIAFFSNGLSDKVIDDTKPWSQRVIESSPLQRILPYNVYYMLEWMATGFSLTPPIQTNIIKQLTIEAIIAAPILTMDTMEGYGYGIQMVPVRVCMQQVVYRLKK
jgi:hypothetical protein